MIESPPSAAASCTTPIEAYNTCLEHGDGVTAVTPTDSRSARAAAFR